MTKKFNFSSFDEAIEFIIKQLSLNEIDLIKNGNEQGLHLGLSRWVLSEFVNNRKTNISLLAREIIIDKTPGILDNEAYIHPDNITGFIIEGLIRK